MDAEGEQRPVEAEESMDVIPASEDNEQKKSTLAITSNETLLKEESSVIETETDKCKKVEGSQRDSSDSVGFEAGDNSDVGKMSDSAGELEEKVAHEFSVINDTKDKPEIELNQTAQTATVSMASGYEEQFANFLKQNVSRQTTDTAEITSDSLTAEEKSNTKIILKRQVFGESVSNVAEESSNSSWYKIQDKKEPMDVSVQDENSNASVVSSNIGDSNMSFPDQPSNMDECSNLSAVSFSGHAPTFDESANLNPPSNTAFVRPDTPSSVTADAENGTPVKKPSRRGTLQIAADDASEHGHGLTAADIFEYQWPQEPDAEYFMLQEQISMYLDIKSFKRKYPDLQRRVCDKIEKDFLRDKGVVSETQSDLGLTALKSEDVHDLMSKDYPAKYKEFVKILHERAKEDITNKMKEYATETLQPKMEKDKIIEYTKKAMRSASEWNRNLLKEKNEERRSYFDMQTFTIQYPRCKFRKLESIQTEVTAYPLSLIPGQFQDYYRSYTPEDLKYFPMNTALFDPPKKMDAMSRLQQQIEEDAESQEADSQRTAGSVSGSDSDDDSSSSSSESEAETDPKSVEVKKEKSSSREASKEKSAEPTIKIESAECRICTESDEKKKGRQKPKVDEELIQCSECKRNGHPSCLDLTAEMVKTIKTYPWQCMECKTCVECMDPYDEDKMMFCDKCDRGYHTFCVGLKSLPTGHWECKSCLGDSTPTKPIPRPTPKSRRGARKLTKDSNGKATPAKETKE